MGFEKIITVEEFDKIAGQESFVVFKASTTCNISQDAFREFEAFMSNNPNINSYYLYVQEARPLSNYIADKYGIKHESPQVLYIKGGRVIWNESHWRITEESLAGHIS